MRHYYCLSIPILFEFSGELHKTNLCKKETPKQNLRHAERGQTFLKKKKKLLSCSINTKKEKKFKFK